MLRSFVTGLTVAFLLLIAAVPLAGAERFRTENQKIEAMIAHVEGLKQAKFVRNGVEYDAQIAGRFLRYIWNNNQERVKTADDFIRIVATASGAGIPYLVRFPDGRESKSRDYLTELLKKWEMPAEK
jgi:tetrahydromethanopterin S-methyltransferase subunit A